MSLPAERTARAVSRWNLGFLREKGSKMKFRDLTAEEIEVRVSRVTNAGVELLLYKDARVDQNILDETVGAENWQCEYY
jgi:hypothetical protein